MEPEVEVLGPLRVLVDGRPAELGPARRRTLLAALALEPGHVVGLDLIADRIWDGEPPANPAPTVHAYVSRLRASLRTFGPDGAEVPSVLVTRAPGYALDVPRRSLDAQRFVEDVREARALAADDPARARTLVRGTLALWRGDAYADVAAEFARREADRLAGLRLDALELAAQVDLSLGRHESLVGEAGALVAEHPLREGLQRAYLLALYRSGRQAEALRHYAVVRELMADELGIDPGPDLRALHEAILRQDAALDPPAAPAGGLTVADAAPAPPVRADVDSAAPTGPRLVGRERELARLAEAVDRAAAGTATPVAVVGEAGIGKSRLLEEAAGLAARRGALVAWGRCWQHEGAPVLWPWLQALESLVDQLGRVDPGALDRALGGRGAGVAALVPALADRTPSAPPPVTPSDGAQLVLYAAVAAFLEAVADGQTVVMLLEDMHWADPGSRELAEYVVGHVRSARLALVLTVRSPTDEAVRTGSELLTSLARSGRGERVDLGGLEPEAVAAYVADRTGSLPDHATSSALAERTGGNPFFVGELVRLLVTDVAHHGDDAAPLDDVVPDSIRDVIARRLDRLPETDRTVLRVAAVVGRTFDLALLEAACGLDEDDVDEAVDRATELGIVVSEPGRIGRHRFVHALTQQTLLDVTGPARLRRLHTRVAQALEARGENVTPEQAERLAFHLAASGSEDELVRAVELNLDAARVALLRTNFPEAESLLLRALELTARLPGDRGAGRELTVRVRLWSLYTATYGPGAPGAAGQHERVVELIRRHGGARELLAVHQAQFARLIWFDDLDGVANLVEEMAGAAEAADDDLMRVAAHLARAQGLLHRGRLAESAAAFAEITALGGQAMRGAPSGVFPLEPQCATLVYRSVVERLAGDRAAATASLDELDRHLPHVSVTSVAYCDTNASIGHALADEPVEALARLRAARVLAERHRFVEALMVIDLFEAWARERLEPGSAMADLDAALSALAVFPSHAHRPAMHGLRAQVRLVAGDLDGAEADLDAASAAQDATGNRLFAARLHTLRADLFEARGTDPAAVAAERETAHRVAVEQGTHAFA
ncbi:hypothetical protein GCM10023340_31860 [Nocardioides marinquilinus]|uniref:OmpR/PhoB-type domain-containing protein n=1 Tax=Nocardioides marinquilinus TaxID=1210400 RepID=A0ABP9PTU4_9ACTN